MNERTHIDLYTGIGGFSLAARANGVRTVVMCECEEWLAKGLERTWQVPVHRDVCKLDGYPLHGAWLLTAGTPCQPASRAGKQRGEADHRWLWHQTIRVIAESHPRWALLENPPGIDDVGLGGIIAEVARLGYEVGICSIPACAVNSPQDRERYWIICGPLGDGGTSGLSKRELQPGISGQEGRGGSRQAAAVATEIGVAQRDAAGGVVAGSAERGQPMRGSAPRQPGLGLQQPQSESLADSQHEQRRRTGAAGSTQGSHSGPEGSPSLGGWTEYEWLRCPDGKDGCAVRRVPTGFYELADGLSARLPRKFYSRIIGALGNAIVSKIAEEIIAAMIKAEE